MRGNPSITLSTDASSYGWAVSLNMSTGGEFGLEECKLHINSLALKAVNCQILLKVDNASSNIIYN